MKVSFLIQDLFQQGAQYVTALMARGFHEKGYEVDILVSQVHENLLKAGNTPFEVPSAVKFVVMPSRRARYNISYIHSYIKHTAVDAVIVMNSAYLYALALASIGLRHKTRYCYVEHNGLSLECVENISIVKNIVNKFVISRYDSFMSVSKGSCVLFEKLMGLNVGDVKVVYNPVLDNTYYVVEGLLTKEVASGVYHMADDEALSTNELIAVICEAMGRRAHIWHLNKKMMEMVASAGGCLHLPLNKERLAKLTENYVVSNRKIKSALGVDKMPVRAKEGLIKTIKSF